MLTIPDGGVPSVDLTCVHFPSKKGKQHLAQQEKKSLYVSSTCVVQGRAGKDVLCNVLRLAALHCSVPQQETRDPLSIRTETTGLPSAASSATMWHWWGTCDQPRGEEQVGAFTDKERREEGGGAGGGRNACIFGAHPSPLRASSAEVFFGTAVSFLSQMHTLS